MLRENPLAASVGVHLMTQLSCRSDATLATPVGGRTPGRTPWSAAGPLAGSLPLVKNFSTSCNYPATRFYQRRLPHFDQPGQPVFLTWRQHDSPHRSFPAAALNSGQAFTALDRLLDEASRGPFSLRQPAIAKMVSEAIRYNADNLGHYLLHAYIVMPNHFHLLITPAIALPTLTESLEGITAKRANILLRLTGKAFWQDESYVHLVRGAQEFEKIRNYLEENPVRAGLVKEAIDYPWSSAGGATRGVRPTE